MALSLVVTAPASVGLRLLRDLGAGTRIHKGDLDALEMLLNREKEKDGNRNEEAVVKVNCRSEESEDDEWKRLGEA